MIVYKAASRIRLPCIYVFYFPKNVFTHSHDARFLLNVNGFWREGFEFKVFTWAAKHSRGR